MYLIQREKDPYKSCWTFAGGKLEPEESYTEATLREVREETGMDVRLLTPNRPDYAQHLKGSTYNYLILTSAAVVVKENNPLIEKIKGRWFDCPSETEGLQDKECTPDLKSIVNIALENHFKI